MNPRPWGESPTMKWAMAIESTDPWWFVRDAAEELSELVSSVTGRYSNEWSY